MGIYFPGNCLTRQMTQQLTPLFGDCGVIGRLSIHRGSAGKVHKLPSPLGLPKKRRERTADEDAGWCIFDMFWICLSVV